MGRCFGITRNMHRCGRTGNWKLFCTDHRRQPFVWLFIFVFTVLSGVASMQSAWWPHQPYNSVNPDSQRNDSGASKPAPLAKQARILFVDKKLILPEKEGDPVRISYGLVNTGNADATVTLRDSTFYFSTNPVQTVFKYQPNLAEEVQVSAIPNAVWRGEMRFNFQLTRDKLEALNSGKARLFFYAHVVCQDVTGKIYRIPFAEMYDPWFPGNLIAPPKDVVFEGGAVDGNWGNWR